VLHQFFEAFVGVIDIIGIVDASKELIEINEVVDVYIEV